MSRLQINGDSVQLTAQDEIQTIVGNGGTAIKINSLTDMNVDKTGISDGQQRLLQWSSANNRFEVVDVDLGSIGTALQPGDPVSELNNDANYISSGDNISLLNNDSGYITGETITMADFKAVVAASTDFDDFQTRVAAL
jgi:hypothetical protein